MTFCFFCFRCKFRKRQLEKMRLVRVLACLGQWVKLTQVPGSRPTKKKIGSFVCALKAGVLENQAPENDCLPEEDP